MSTRSTTDTATATAVLDRDAHDHLSEHLDAEADARAVALLVASHRELWAPLVRFDPEAPSRARVWADDHWEVRLGAWLPGQASHAHEHVDRPGALLVLQGSLTETTWHVATDGPTPGRRHAVARVWGPGTLRTHSHVHVHALSAQGTDPVLALDVLALPAPPSSSRRVTAG